LNKAKRMAFSLGLSANMASKDVQFKGSCSADGNYFDAKF